MSRLLVLLICTLTCFSFLVASNLIARATAPPAEDPVPELIKALGDETALVRKRAAVALQKLGPAARPAAAALQKALTDDDAEVRAAAAAALRTIGGPLSRDELLALVKDRQQPAAARGAACKELAERFPQDAAVVKALEALLTDAAVKVEAARALEAMDGKPLPRKVSLEITFKGHTAPVTCLLFTPDGKTLISGAGEQGKAGEIRLWDVDGERPKKGLDGHNEMVTALAVTADGKTLASASGVYDKKLERWSEGEIKLWNLKTGELVTTWRGHTKLTTSLVFLVDGKTLVSAAEDRAITFWDAEQGHELRTIKGHEGAVTALAVTPDGKTLASASSDRTVRLWDVATYKAGPTLKGHSGPVAALAFSADGKTLVSTGSVYDLEMGKSLSGEVKVWDVPSGTERATLKKHTDVVSAVALIPDGQAMVTASADTTMKLWDLTTRAERTAILGHTSRVSAVAVTADGKLLASGSGDRTVKLWQIIWEK
jgi:WD40 repeat protein